MRILMRTLSAGPTGILHPGKVYELPESEAQALVKGGYASRVDVDVAKAEPARTGETATARPARPNGKPPRP